MHEPRLDVRQLCAGYGKSQVLQGVSLSVAEGEVVAVLGANGTGKSTFMNTLTGFVPSASGDIFLDGQRVTGLAPHLLFRRGIVQVSQTRDLFPDLSVADNLMLGGVMATGSEADKRRELERVYEYFPRLKERLQQRASTLSGGEQQMVAIGRALMGKPRLLLLDEPSAGLAPQFVREIGHIISRLQAAGATILLVEQDIAAALRVADRVLLLRNGVFSTADLGDSPDESHHELARRLYF